MVSTTNKTATWLLRIILVFILVFCMGTTAYGNMSIGTKIGEVLSTDIIATIDQKPIPSMNINGYTAIVVEDLRSYGFDVVWNEASKTLTVNRNETRDVVGKEFNLVRLEPGSYLKPVLFTDIKTYLDGKEIVSFNIDGQTAVYFNQLKSYGDLQWNEASRIASLDFPLLDAVQAEPPVDVAVSRRTTQLDPRDSSLSQQPLDKSTLPALINVGLFFNDSAVSSLRVMSPNGFMVGDMNGERFSSVLYLSDAQSLTLEPDHHAYIQLKRAFSLPSQAQEVIESLSADRIKGIMVREARGWNVYIGPYRSIRDADDELYYLGLKNDEWEAVGTRLDRVQVLDQQNNVILVYHDQSPLYLTDKEGIINESILQIGSDKYRGAVTALRNNSHQLTVINRLLIEQYLYGVVPREMPATWHIEALKAQAVAARGFALANIGKFQSLGFDVCNTVNSQVYGGFNAENANVRKAVDDTYGKVMSYDGKLVIPYYHSNSGGQTESSENVWTEALPYARGINDPFSIDAPHGQWRESMNYHQLEQRLTQSQIDIGSITRIRVDEVSENGRVMQLTLQGTRGSHVVTKQDSRWIFGLRSNYYQITESNNQVIFDGNGYGHGVGMSQHGARVMAEMGYSWQDILLHYYTGVRIN